MVDPKSFAAALVFVCGFAGVTSVAGMLPVRYRGELYDVARRAFSLVDLFALGVIEVACIGYVWSMFPSGDESDQLAFASGVGCVATFWWFVISTRLAVTGQGSLARGLYLCFFVPAAFVCPFIVAIGVVEIVLPFEARPAMEYEADLLRASVAAGLYLFCFPLNRWLSVKYRVDGQQGSDLPIESSEACES